MELTGDEIELRLKQALDGSRSKEVPKDALITAIAAILTQKFCGDVSTEEGRKYAMRLANKPWEVIEENKDVALGVVLALLTLLKSNTFPAFITGDAHKWIHTLLDTAAAAVVGNPNKHKTAYETLSTKH